MEIIDTILDSRQVSDFGNFKQKPFQSDTFDNLDILTYKVGIRFVWITIPYGKAAAV